MIFRYVQHYLALDYCRMGWMPTFALRDTHHGDYSVMLQWPCACKPFKHVAELESSAALGPAAGIPAVAAGPNLCGAAA